MEIVRITKSSTPSQAAGAIAHFVRAGQPVAVHAISVDAITANAYLKPEGLQVACVPSWVDVEVDGQERTAAQFTLEVRRISKRPGD